MRGALRHGRVGVAYFTAYDPTYGSELWRSDGTAAGTVLSADIAPGAAASKPSALAAIGGILYFTATDPATSVDRLWRFVPAGGGTTTSGTTTSGTTTGGTATSGTATTVGATTSGTSTSATTSSSGGTTSAGSATTTGPVAGGGAGGGGGCGLGGGIAGIALGLLAASLRRRRL